MCVLTKTGVRQFYAKAYNRPRAVQGMAENGKKHA